MVEFFPDKNINSEESDWLATLFDVGGILGNNDMLDDLSPFHLAPVVPRTIYYMWCPSPLIPYCSCTMPCLCIGGIVTGVLSDVLNARAVSCVLSLILAVPSVSFSQYHNDEIGQMACVSDILSVESLISTIQSVSLPVLIQPLYM